jgi:hypothetical protein
MNLEKEIKDLRTSKVSPNGGDLEGAIIRRAEKSDCIRLMELVNQLAIYERAPEARKERKEESLNTMAQPNKSLQPTRNQQALYCRR